MTWPRVRFEAEPKASTLFISILLGIALPAILSIYWIAYWTMTETVSSIFRILVLGGAVLLGLFWYRAPLSHAEILLFRVLGVAALAWLISALAASNRSHALGGWAKLIILFLVCGLAARGLRHPPTARAFGYALLVSGVLLVFFILFVYFRMEGWVLPTFKAARQFKGAAAFANLPLNDIAFSAVISYLMGLCLVPAKRFLVILGLPVFYISSMFTGSRAPLVLLGVAVFIWLTINGLRSRSARVRFATAVLAAVAVAGLIVVVANVSDKAVSDATEGRSHLWKVGLQKFAERPLFGYGYETWRDDLVSRLPGEFDLTFDLAARFGGSYHNEYIAVLAEEGIIGAVGSAAIVWLLVRCSWLLAFRSWATVCSKGWPLFTVIFLLLRANFEVPGLFGYGQGPADYLAYLLVAIVLSRFSVEEDYARLLALRGVVTQ